MVKNVPVLLKALVVALSLGTAAIVATPAYAADKHPTIRHMAGAKEIAKLDPKTTAVIVIDFQNEYFTGKMPIPDGKPAMENAKRLIAFADKEKMQVFQVQHVSPAGSAVFASDGDAVKFHAGMQPRTQDIVIQKSNVSAFVGTDLDKRLKAANIKTVIIAGLMTHACVAGAARDAAPLGYQVIVASDAAATRAITRENGSKVSAKELHATSLASIEDTFGDVMTTAQILHLPLEK